MINGTETLKTIIDTYPEFVAEFEKRGLGA